MNQNIEKKVHIKAIEKDVWKIQAEERTNYGIFHALHIVKSFYFQ